MAERIGAFALEPFYDEVLAELGAPPLGVPHELTAEYAWAAAHEKIEAENRAAKREATAQPVAVAKAPAKRPAKKAPAKRAPAKRPTVTDRLSAEFGE